MYNACFCKFFFCWLWWYKRKIHHSNARRSTYHGGSYLLKGKSNVYSGNIISGADVAATLTKGEIDFVVAPTNAGMKVSMLKGKYKIIATTSWGNLYLVGTTNIKTLEECSSATEFLNQFSGANVDSIGTNQVPDVSFKHLLSLASVNCTLNASTDATVIMASLKTAQVVMVYLANLR